MVDASSTTTILSGSSRGSLSVGVLVVLNTNDALYPVGVQDLPDIASEVIRSLRKVDASSTTTILSGSSRRRFSVGVLGVLNTMHYIPAW
jgi:hypothetical protein